MFVLLTASSCKPTSVERDSRVHLAGLELGGGRLELPTSCPTSCSLSGDAILLQGCCLRVPRDGYIISPAMGLSVDVPLA